MKIPLRISALTVLFVGLLAAAPGLADEEVSRGSATGTGKAVTTPDPSREVSFSKGRVLAPDIGLSHYSMSPRPEGTLEAHERVSLGQAGCTICLTGSASVQWTGSTGSFHVDAVSNNRSFGTSGPLDLSMILTTSVPVFGQTVNSYAFSNLVSLSPLAAGYYYSNVNSGTIPFLGNTIPAGEYFLLLFLRENVSGTFHYNDWLQMNTKVSCSGTGCSIITQPVGCTEEANTACLIGGRYKVTSHWKNQFAGGATANLFKAKLTDTTNAFWLFDAGTYECVIRINTATDNGRAWVTILTFTQVEFWVDVTDTKSGQFKEYHSNPGNTTLIYDPVFFVYP